MNSKEILESRALMVTKGLNLTQSQFFKNYEEEIHDYEEEIHELLCELIIEYPKDNYKINNDQKIMDIYYNNFNWYKGYPDFDDIIYDIHEYNEEIFRRIAYIEFDNYVHFLDSTKTKEENIQDIIDSWINDYWEYFSSLDYYVAQLLIDRKVIYNISKTSDSYTRYFQDSNVIMSVNDCQNILLSDFHFKGQEYLLDYYTEEYIKKIQIIRSI